MSFLTLTSPYMVKYPQALGEPDIEAHHRIRLEDLIPVFPRTPVSRDYYRPWSHTTKDVGSKVTSDKEKFQVVLDVQHFTPEEISVKTVDGFIIIDGKHEEKQDTHGFISRQFKRRYALPDNCDVATVESKLSSDGVLTVTAPKAISLKNERNIPITQTGPIRQESQVKAGGQDGTTQQTSQTDANGTEK